MCVVDNPDDVFAAIAGDQHGLWPSRPEHPKILNEPPPDKPIPRRKACLMRRYAVVIGSKPNPSF